MKTKPLTKLQKIKQKAYQQGIEEQSKNVEYYRNLTNSNLARITELEKEIEIHKQRNASFRDIMQAINTISQGTSRL